MLWWAFGWRFGQPSHLDVHINIYSYYHKQVSYNSYDFMIHLHKHFHVHKIGSGKEQTPSVSKPPSVRAFSSPTIFWLLFRVERGYETQGRNPTLGRESFLVSWTFKPFLKIDWILRAIYAARFAGVLFTSRRQCDLHIWEPTVCIFSVSVRSRFVTGIPELL